jgi:predicted transcriptional regulator
MNARILQTSYQDLSPMDRRFLHAMTQDKGPSNVSDIARRLGKSSSYVSQYRKRLIEQGVIGPRGTGLVDFELPLMREFLLELGDPTAGGSDR